MMEEAGAAASHAGGNDVDAAAAARDEFYGRLYYALYLDQCVDSSDGPEALAAMQQARDCAYCGSEAGRADFMTAVARLHCELAS